VHFEKNPKTLNFRGGHRSKSSVARFSRGHRSDLQGGHRSQRRIRSARHKKSRHKGLDTV